MSTAAATPEDITREAFTAAGGRHGEFVGIELVRLEMSRRGLDRRQQDEVLTAMYCRREVCLVPQSNQRALTWLRREVALEAGGEAKHLVCVR